MAAFLDKFKGYRTYITVALAFVIGGLSYVGVIDSATAEKITGLLTLVGLGFLRAGINNSK